MNEPSDKYGFCKAMKPVLERDFGPIEGTPTLDDSGHLVFTLSRPIHSVVISGTLPDVD